jgi:hypothetical protein
MNKKFVFSIKLSILAMLFIAVTLSGCFSPWQGNNAKFVISFAGAERSAFARDGGETEEAVNIRDLEHRIELTRESEKITFSGKGAAVEGYAPAGNWAISVYSYFGGELYAAGSGEISLQDGQENVVTITMRRAYKVTFNSNGGSGEVPPITVMNGDSIELPGGDGLYKDGFDFIGWNTEADGTGTHYEAGETYPAVTGNITLYAVWVPLVTDDTPITNPAVIIAAPGKGVAPDTEAIVDADNFTAGEVSWQPDDSLFRGGVEYTATVTLIAADGFTFIGSDTATVNGQSVDVKSNTGKAVTLSYTFARTIDKIAANIEIITQPELVYTHLDTLNLTALVVKLTYDDGTTDNVPFASFNGNNITTNPAHGSQLTYPTTGGVTVSCGGASVTTSPLTVNERVISIKTINGVTAPATGAAAVTSIGATDEYTVNIAWTPALSSDGKFASATTYTATITIAPKTGYTVQGLEADFFSVAGATTSFNANTRVITAQFPQTATTVNIQAIQGVTAPVTGAARVTAITGNDQYSGTVTWSPNNSTFASATVYTATITLTAKAGYTLQGVAANYFTVAGVTSVRNSANSGVITSVFPKTDTTVNTPAIAGVTVPSTRHTPVVTITETAQYTGTVIWSGSNPSTFAPETIYTATITLSAKTGYTFTGVGANYFTVAGATSVSNTAGFGVVTVEFPQTGLYGLGETGPGAGKIFYYSAEGFTFYTSATDTGTTCHYLEAAPADMNSTLEWALMSSQAYGDVPGTGTAIGTGMKNTAIILAKDTTAPAAIACNEYSNGGTTDWFLPSKDELYQLVFVNRTSVDNLDTERFEYWSSSQYGTNYSWSQRLDGLQGSIQKFQKLAVRAIRAF